MIWLAIITFASLFVFFSHYEIQQWRGTRGLVIGPWIKGRSHSKGYPLRLKRWNGGWSIGLDGELHAVLDYDAKISSDATKLVWHYRAEIEGAFPAERPAAAPLVSLVLQRKGDDWSAEGSKASYRLYSPPFPLETGEQVREIPLTGWTNVWGRPADIGPVIANLSNIAVAFGHSSGRMHGVTGRGTFHQLALTAQT